MTEFEDAEEPGRDRVMPEDVRMTINSIGWLLILGLPWAIPYPQLQLPVTMAAVGIGFVSGSIYNNHLRKRGLRSR